MKYIRTKNGKIHISYNDYQGFEKLWVCEKRNTLADFYYVRRSSIVAQADTIEELCDQFVLIDENEYDPPISRELIGKRFRAMFDEFKFRVSEGAHLSKMSLYGAIWTDKGLIYVAKMNDEGRLELL